MPRTTEVKFINENTVEYVASVRANDRKDPNRITFTIDITGMTRNDAIEAAFAGSNLRISRANHLRDTKTHEELMELAKIGVKGKWDDELTAQKVMTPDKAVNTIHNLNREGFIKGVKSLGATDEEALKMWDRKVQSVLRREE